MTKIVCWNVAGWKKPWDELRKMGADVALLQEAHTKHLRLEEEIPEEHWNSHCWTSDWYKAYWPRLTDRWPAVVRLSEKVHVDWFKQVFPISQTKDDSDWFAVSGIGTVAAARVTPQAGDTHVGEPFIAVSMYARWIEPRPEVKTRWSSGFTDGSAHRIISDLSAFIGSADPSSHRILAAGDLNLVYGARSDGNWSTARDRTVWDRMKALGFEYLGPRDGSTAGWCNRANVPTFCARGTDPSKAREQFDYAFASRGFHELTSVRALNSPDEWGSSDHCRLVIEVSG